MSIEKKNFDDKFYRFFYFYINPLNTKKTSLYGATNSIKLIT